MNGENHPFGVLLSTFTAITLSHAMQLDGESLDPRAIPWLALSLLLACLGVCLPKPTRQAGLPLQARASRIERFALLCAAAWFTLELWDLFNGTTFRNWLLIAGGLGAASLLAPPRLSRAPMAALLLFHLLLGLWTLRASPNPAIDVFQFQRDALDALLSGNNPYSMTFAYPFPNTSHYGPGLIENGRTTFGFMYPPVSLLLALPGHCLAGDARYSHLIALTLTGAMMAWTLPSPLSRAAAMLFLFQPQNFDLLRFARSELLLLFTLSLFFYSAVRRPSWVGWTLGLFLACKQYAVLSIPLVWLLWSGPSWKSLRNRHIAQALLVCIASAAPFFLADPAAFWRSLITLQALQPLRLDSMSFLAWLGRNAIVPPLWLGFATLPLTLALALRRTPSSLAAFANTQALIYLAFFAFSKQAFYNYYFFILGTLCWGLSLHRKERA